MSSTAQPRFRAMNRELDSLLAPALKKVVRVLHETGRVEMFSAALDSHGKPTFLNPPEELRVSRSAGGNVEVLREMIRATDAYCALLTAMDHVDDPTAHKLTIAYRFKPDGTLETDRHRVEKTDDLLLERPGFTATGRKP